MAHHWMARHLKCFQGKLRVTLILESVHINTTASLCGILIYAKHICNKLVLHRMYIMNHGQ